MKNLILCISVFSLFFSCNKSESVQPTVADLILGEWTLSSFVMICDDESQNVALTRSDENGCVEFLEDEKCLNLEFFADGTAKGTDITETLTYTTDEESKTINLCFDGTDCVRFTLIGDQLSFDEDEDDCVCTFGFEK